MPTCSSEGGNATTGLDVSEGGPNIAVSQITSLVAFRTRINPTLIGDRDDEQLNPSANESSEKSPANATRNHPRLIGGSDSRYIQRASEATGRRDRCRP